MKEKILTINNLLPQLHADLAYIYCKLIGALDYKKIFQQKCDCDWNGKTTIKSAFCKKLNIKPEQYNSYSRRYDKQIQYIKMLHSKRNQLCIVEFYNWYVNQDKACCYCGVKEDDLDVYFNKKNIQYKNARQRGQRLEIERVDTIKNEYKLDNMRLACYICNNAKSDFISAQYFRPIARGIYQFWKDTVKVTAIEFPENSTIWNEHKLSTR